MGNLRYIEDVATLALHDDRCIGCGLCVQVCPHNVFEMTSGKAMIADGDACMECGACVKNCPSMAISVHPGVG